MFNGICTVIYKKKKTVRILKEIYENYIYIIDNNISSRVDKKR